MATKVETNYLSGSHKNPDILDAGIRKNIIDEIICDENISRKRFEQRKFDIYRNRQAPYVVERLRLEFSQKTVDRMRKVLSINPCKRIVDQMGSIYASEPTRNFSGTGADPKAPKPQAKPAPGAPAPAEPDKPADPNADPNADPKAKPDPKEQAAPAPGQPPLPEQLPGQLTPVQSADEELEQKLDDVYHHCGIDPQMRLANRYYKLCDQAFLYLVPQQGKLRLRALTPKDLDVIPDAQDPERAFCYILNVFDVNLYGPPATNTKEDPNRYYSNSKVERTISNDSDRDRKLARYVWWTDENHFTTDGFGELVDDETGDTSQVENPIGEMPFIDIALEKDFQFFVKRGNNVAEFTIDLLTQLSDLAEISRLQGYSQAIIYSTEEPKDLTVGPNKVMWVKQPMDGQQSQPKFAFESPTPDLANSLEIINTQLKMFLSSLGLDAGTVTGDTPKRAFTSGIDHLLANVDKFQASQEDIDLFRHVETKLFKLIKLWLNAWQDVTDEPLDDELKIGKIDDKISLEVDFPEPAIVQTQTEKEDSVIKRWDNDLLTTKDAIKELYDYDDTKAEEYMIELEADKLRFPRPALPTFGQPDATGKPQQGAVGPDGKLVAPDAGAAPGKPGEPAPAPGKAAPVPPKQVAGKVPPKAPPAK